MTKTILTMVAAAAIALAAFTTMPAKAEDWRDAAANAAKAADAAHVPIDNGLWQKFCPGCAPPDSAQRSIIDRTIADPTSAASNRDLIAALYAFLGLSINSPCDEFPGVKDMALGGATATLVLGSQLQPPLTKTEKDAAMEVVRKLQGQGWNAWCKTYAAYMTDAKLLVIKLAEERGFGPEGTKAAPKIPANSGLRNVEADDTLKSAHSCTLKIEPTPCRPASTSVVRTTRRRLRQLRNRGGSPPQGT